MACMVSDDKCRRVEAVLQRFVGDAFPGASLAVVSRGELVCSVDVGYAQLVPVKRPLREGTLFDLASLTKVLSTTLIVMRLIEDGYLHLNQRVSEILPDFPYTNAGRSDAKERVRVWMLLSHTSGLPAWLPLYKSSRSRDELIEQAIKAYPVYEPGSRVVYSDLNFIVTTAIVEKLTGARIDRLFEEYVAKPLGLRRTTYLPLDRFPIDEIAATELDEVGNVLVGVVHDENARAMGGVSGHAGLFSTSREVAAVANSLLESYKSRGGLLSTASVKAMWSPWSCSNDSPCYGLGWQVYKRGVTISGGDLLTEGKAFGHTGYTGTSIWIDVELDLAIALLTNRVHPTRSNTKIEHARPIIHNTVVSTLTSLRH